MSTKTYHYDYLGVPGSVEVTVTFTPCNIEANGPTPMDRIGYKNANIQLSEALPFDLFVQLQYTNEYIENNNSGSISSLYTITVPEGLSTHQVTGLKCFDQQGEPFIRNEISYEFLDQTTPQVVGGPLQAEVKSVTDATCHGTPTGKIVVEATLGSGTYNYQWSDGGPNQPDRINIPAGTYSVIVTDTSGGEVILNNIVVGQPSQILASPSITHVSCHGGSSGAISLSPSGGSGSGYTFLWSDGSTSQNRTGLTSGLYSVRITDSSGCSRNFNLTVNQPTQIIITVNQAGRDVIMQIEGGTAPYTYLWSDENTERDRFNLPNGTYTFTVTDANGCSQSTSVVVDDFKFYFSKNPVWLIAEADLSSPKPNLSFVCEVFIEKEYESGDFEPIYDTEHPSRVGGTTDFNIQQVLNAFLDAQVPAFPETQPRMVEETFKRFYLRYFEKYGNPPAPAPSVQVDTYYVLYGGLSDQEFAKGTFFDTYLDQERPFLTWQPKEIQVDDIQHAYLHYVVASPVIESIRLHVTAVYEDGASVSLFMGDAIQGVKPFEVYRFPVGIPQLALLDLDPDRILREYTVQLMDGETQVSEQRMYRRKRERGHYRRLLFLNSLGGWDSLLCMGRGKERLRTQEESITRDLPVGFAYHDRERETVSKTGTHRMECVITNLNGAERMHLIDLSISEKVYLQTASGYLPVSVDFPFDPADDWQNIETVELDITLPTVKRYTPEL